MTMAFCFLVLVKGAFAMFALVGAALWVVVVPAPENGSNRWAWAGLAAAVITAALMLAGYEALYVRTTGESFLEFYRSTRLGASMRLNDLSVVPHALVNVGWYLVRLAWFAAPWSLVAGAAAWVWLRFRMPRHGAAAFRRIDRARADLGAAADGRIHRRAEPRARARRAVHLPDLLRDWGGGGRAAIRTNGASAVWPSGRTGTPRFRLRCGW